MLLTTTSCLPHLLVNPEPVDYCPLFPAFDNRAYTRLNVTGDWGVHAWLYDMRDRLVSLNVKGLRFEHCVLNPDTGLPFNEPIVWEGGPNCVFDVNDFMRSLNLPMSITSLNYTGTVEWFHDFGMGIHEMRYTIQHQFNQPNSYLWGYVPFDFEECIDVTYTEQLANYNLPQWTLL
jgi:hypothetical protein